MWAGRRSVHEYRRSLVSDFGTAWRSAWAIDPQVTYLNHGTVGAPPRRVLAAQQALRDEIERHPARFQLRELADPHAEGLARRPRMRVAADRVAGFVGARGDDLVFVDNITAGANAVLRSMPVEPGDEFLVTSVGYGGVTNAVRYAARTRGATVRTVDMPTLGSPSADFVRAVTDALGERTRLLVIDHVAAMAAIVLPVAEIAAACRRRGVRVLADGAHVPGAMSLDVPSLGVDWYAANLHKWAWAPRSAGFLWVAPEHQAELHPTVISWGLDHGMTAEFDLLGTRDPTPFLTAPFALDLMEEIGFERICAYNRDLALAAGRLLAERWDVDWSTPQEQIATMVTVALPPRFGPGDAEFVRASLESAGFEVPVLVVDGRPRVRVSAQIYLELDDVDRLAAAVDELAAA